MKLTSLSTALAAVLGLALCATAASAQTNTAPMTSAPATTVSTAPMTASTKAKKTPYKGTLSAIDASGASITVQGATGPMMLKIMPNTKYRGAAALTDFAVGDMVTGSYVKSDDGTMCAYSLHKKKAAK
jgi:hypothetical protein